MIVQELIAQLGIRVDQSTLRKAQGALDGLHAGMVALTAGFAAAAAGVQAVIMATARAGEEVSRAAQRTGTSTQALQELRFAATESGVSVEQLDHGLVLLSRSAFEAMRGSLEAADGFRRVGVNVADSNGHMRPTQEILADISERFSRMPDGVAKTALAMRLFGRSGSELIPLLNRGRAGLAELTAKAETFGVVLDDEAIANSKRFVIAGRELRASLQGLAYTIGGPLLRGAGEFTRKLAKWIALHRKAIATPIIHFFQTLRASVRAVVLVGQELVKHTGILYGALSALAVLALGKAVFAFQALTAAELEWGAAAAIAGARAAAGWVLAMAPIAALAGLIALIVQDFYMFKTGGHSLIGEVVKAFDELKRTANNTADDIWIVKQLKQAVSLADTVRHALDAYRLNAAREDRRAALTSEQRDAEDQAAGVPTFRQGLHNFLGNAFGIDAFGPAGAPTPAPNRSAVAVHAPVTVNVTVPPGASPQETGDAVRQSMEQFWQDVLGSTYPAVAP